MHKPKNSSFLLRTVLCTISIFTTSVFLNTVPASCANDGTEGTLYAKGNKIVDSSGREVRLYGLNCPSLEWTTTGDNMPQAVTAAFDLWEANMVRLPMNQDFWFGYHSSQADGGAAYRKLIADIVKIAEERKKYIWLDLHWSNGGTEWGQFTGQHKMPDKNSLVFWESVAKEYSNHPYVLFGLYNEPYGVSWDIWRDGGKVTEMVETDENYKKVRKSITYEAVGMQTLIDAIRALGANNLVIVGGLDWGFDLTSAADEKYRLVDTQEGNGIVLDTHPYPWKSKNWSTIIDKAGEHYPIIVGEFGTNPSSIDPNKPDEGSFRNYHETLFNWIEEKGYSFAAWSFHPGAGPCLIKGWNYDPTPYHGVFVRELLLDEASRGVSLFDGKNYSGSVIDIKPGEYTRADLQAAGMDPASVCSAKLNNDRHFIYRLTLFAEDDFSGSSRAFVFNIPDLKAALDGMAVKSLKIETVTPENINKGSRVECSSNNEDSGAISDGNENTTWMVDEEGPKWVKTDLGAVHTIYSIIICHASDRGLNANNNNQDFCVSVSNDGINWTEVYSVTGNKDYKSVIDFEPVAARYVKVDITKGSLIPPHTRTTISEIEVYGVKTADDSSGGQATDDSPGGQATDNGETTDKAGVKGTGFSLWILFALKCAILLLIAAFVINYHRTKGKKRGN